MAAGLAPQAASAERTKSPSVTFNQIRIPFQFACRPRQCPPILPMATHADRVLATSAVPPDPRASVLRHVLRCAINIRGNHNSFFAFLPAPCRAISNMVTPVVPVRILVPGGGGARYTMLRSPPRGRANGTVL